MGKDADSGALETAGASGDGRKGIERLAEILAEEQAEAAASAVQQVFEQHRDLFVRQFSRLLEAGIGPAPAAGECGGGESPWIPIESLSRLRSTVGGRFENIKKKWEEAGLPLKGHRGDKPEAFVVKQDGWIELSNWILQQGFQARLCESGSANIMEVRAVREDQ